MRKRNLALFTGLALAAGLLTLGRLLFDAAPTQVASFLVANIRDDGALSPRRQVRAANNQPGQDMIAFDPSPNG